MSNLLKTFVVDHMTPVSLLCGEHQGDLGWSMSPMGTRNRGMTGLARAVFAASTLRKMPFLRHGLVRKCPFCGIDPKERASKAASKRHRDSQTAGKRRLVARGGKRVTLYYAAGCMCYDTSDRGARGEKMPEFLPLKCPFDAPLEHPRWPRLPPGCPSIMSRNVVVRWKGDEIGVQTLVESTRMIAQQPSSPCSARDR
jgi:hypothetical protein